ncbi:MAG: GMC oxidoreductase [Geminicoccaceae bacterium]
MIHDFLDYDADAKIECDVCIAGAGAAGIAMARHLIGSSMKVVLLEGGGLDYEDGSQAIYQGHNVGHPYFDLDVTRLRYFGGSTNHWAGECAPLDPIDMEPKAWVPHSGWPITRATLDPWYDRAQDVIGLGDYNYDHISASPPGTPFLDFEGDKIAHKVWRFSEPVNYFGETFRDELDRAGNVEVWLHANLVDIETEARGTHVTDFKISTLDGNVALVSAQHFILALGGLENPRMLLNSDAVNPAGLGNDRDLVGRFFADHLNGVAGEMAVSKSGWEQAYDYVQFDDIRGLTKIRASPNAQSARSLLNNAAHLGKKPTARNTSPGYKALRKVRDDLKHGKFPEELSQRIMDVATDLDGIWDGLVEYFVDSSVYIEVEAEQAPNPDSKVTLIDERDALGLRRMQLDWRLSAIDRESIRGLVQLVGEEAGRLGIGRAKMAEWLMDGGDTWPDHQLGGNHHIGTTRMADDPRNGVVDSNCRVYGIDNLFIAGSSVFPTSGSANPTLTIVALALRLADHIQNNSTAEKHSASRLPQ